MDGLDKMIKTKVNKIPEKDLEKMKKILEEREPKELTEKKPAASPKVAPKVGGITAQSLANELTPLTTGRKVITANELNAIKSKHNLK